MSVKSYPNERDCEHGQLRRSCPTCAADADYAALLARHNALVEAVAWERECEWMNSLITEQYACVSEIAPEEEEISVSYFAARADVDRLIATADCEGEG